jgi:hypothetical protein
MSFKYNNDDIKIELFIKGKSQYIKSSYPVRYGMYSLVETSSAKMVFNPNGEITHLQGKSQWPHPQEWLKRSRGNEWIYYSTGGYTGVFEAIGEYYLPNLSYDSNSLFGGKSLQHESVQNVLINWFGILERVEAELKNPPKRIRDFLKKVLAMRLIKIKLFY